MQPEDVSPLIQTTPAQEATLAEMERKSQDRIRVYNPTEGNFTVVWGGLGFVVPSKLSDMGHGKGQQILPRYIARNYVTKMTDKILGERLVKAVKDANALRAERGQPAMNHWEERLNYEAPFKTDNPQARANILPLLWLGVEEEFGMDVLQHTPEQRRDQRSFDEQVIASLDKPAKRLDDSNLPSISTDPDPVTVNETVLKTSPYEPQNGSLNTPPVQVPTYANSPQPIQTSTPTSENPALNSLMADLTGNKPPQNNG